MHVLRATVKDHATNRPRGSCFRRPFQMRRKISWAASSPRWASRIMRRANARMGPCIMRTISSNAPASPKRARSTRGPSLASSSRGAVGFSTDTCPPELRRGMTTGGVRKFGAVLGAVVRAVATPGTFRPRGSRAPIRTLPAPLPRGATALALRTATQAPPPTMMLYESIPHMHAAICDAGELLIVSNDDEGLSGTAEVQEELMDPGGGL